MSAATMAALADFHFLRPLALLLLLAAPLCWLLWRSGRADANAWRAAVDAHLLPHLIEPGDGGPGRAGIALALALWSLACLALAGPAWEREPMPLYRNQAARVLALELSPTMLAQDDKPNRLARARYKIDDILGRSRDYQTALIGYAGDAFVAAPLTDDIGTVRNLVDALDPGTMPVAGNATGRAIEVAMDLIRQAGLHHGEIVLLADAADSSAIAAARAAHAQGLVVSVLGVGTANGAPVPLAQGDFLKDGNGELVVSRRDDAGLRALAEAGGGRYAALAPDGSDLDALLADQVETGGSDAAAASGSAQSARWRDRGPWLLLVLAPLALLGFRRGWLMLLVFAMFMPMPQARAASLADLWQRPDQQAARALAHGDAKHAAEVARAPEWRGSAAYRAGDYAAAAADYARAGGADGAYNKGNALARLGRYEEALAAYDAALKYAPGMADATANRKAVEDFLKQSKKKQDGSGGSGRKDSTQGKPGGQQPSADDRQGQDQQQGRQDSGDQTRPQDGQDGAQQAEQPKSQDSSDPSSSGDKKDDAGGDRKSVG